MSSDVITFTAHVFRIIELQFVVPIPERDGADGPVYMRAYVDRALGDKPGSIKF